MLVHSLPIKKSDPFSVSRPIYGLIFLFKWQKETDDRPIDPDFQSRGVFFANQVINNACATQAIISVLMNVPHNQPGFDLGNELRTLREFTQDFPPDVRGLAIGNSEAIRTVHNSFHPPQPLIPDENDQDKDADAFHFVAYVPAAGGLYELDGLKPGPIRICECDPNAWLSQAAEAVTARIAKYSESEQRFNLMAVVQSRYDLYCQQLAEVQSQALQLLEQIAAAAEGSREELETKLSGLNSQIYELSSAVASEERKRQRWTDENLRRRTDYTPFAFNLLQALATNGQLHGLVGIAEEEHRQSAREKQQQRMAEKK